MKAKGLGSNSGDNNDVARVSHREGLPFFVAGFSYFLRRLPGRILPASAFSGSADT
jgi:hypothetical protein